MDMYQVHSVTIRKSDRDKADAILMEHYEKGDIDDLTVDVIVHKDCDGNDVITYWIRPYIYEDLKSIISEFKQTGIQVM